MKKTGFASFILLLILMAGLSVPAMAAPKDAKEALAAKPTTSQLPVKDKIEAKRIAVDLNRDEKPDRWEYYEDGVLIKLEADSNGDGKIDERGIIKEGKLVQVQKDSDGDGKVDQWVDY